MTTLRTCRMGTGLTAASKFLVRKSKKNLGQKKASRAPASWSCCWLLGFDFVLGVGLKSCWTYSLLM
jgi:hypothetical protein